MVILIVGLGSIGKRHLNNLESLGIPCRDIRIMRTRRGAAAFGDEVIKTHGGRHEIFTDLSTALEGSDIVFVTNPNSLHVETALRAAKRGCSVFIEKPLGISMDGVDSLIAEVARHGTTACVGYDLRYHPLARTLKQIVEKNEIGEVRWAETWMSEQVTDWHPWESHTVSYACRKDLGGGVIMTQSHEIDLLHFLFGVPRRISTRAWIDPSLPMDVPNVAESWIDFDSFTVRHFVSYLGPKRRFVHISGSKGYVYWDFYGGTMRVQRKGTLEIIREPDGFERNRTFLSEIESFLQSVQNHTDPETNALSEARDVLRTLLAMEESASRDATIASLVP